MNCEATEKYLSEAGDRPPEPLPEPLLKHLLTCDGCRLSMERFSVRGTEWHRSAGVRHRITSQIAHYLLPVTPVPSQATLILATVGVLVAVPSVTLIVIGDGGLHVMTAPQLLAWLLVIGTAEGVLSVSVAGLMVPGCRHRMHPRLLAFLCVAGYFLAALLIFQRNGSSILTYAGAACLLVGCAVASFAALLLWSLTRKGAVLSWPRMGTAIGLLAGLVGTSVLLFHCKSPDMMHAAVWHTGVLLISTGIGSALGVLPQLLASR